MEKFKETRDQIKNLASDEITLEECKKGVIDLDQDLDNYFNKLSIQKFLRGRFFYFRTVEYDYKTIPGQKRNIYREKLGRILKSDYEKNKKKINQLVQEKDKDQLKTYLETY